MPLLYVSHEKGGRDELEQRAQGNKRQPGYLHNDETTESASCRPNGRRPCSIGHAVPTVTLLSIGERALYNMNIHTNNSTAMLRRSVGSVL